MKNLFHFIFSKAFLFNLIVALLLVIALIWGVLNYLDTYTEHNQSITVPDFVGFKTSEIKTFIADKQLRDSIIDSVYYPNLPKSTVVAQDPSPDAQVKKNRRIYLTVNAVAPFKISMPNLLNLSYRQAITTLVGYGLKVDSLRYVPEQCFNCVVGQEYKGKPIAPGTMIESGRAIVIVLGEGESKEKTMVPSLIGLSKEEATTLLNSKFLNVGGTQYEACKTAKDSLQAKVYMQVPPYGREATINIGGAVDIFLTTDASKIVINDSLAGTDPMEINN